MGDKFKTKLGNTKLHVKKIKTVADKMAQWIKSLVVNV